MPKTISRDNPQRLKFEKEYGRTIRHDHWLKICSEMKQSGLEKNHRNLTFYAHFKQIFPRKTLTKEMIEKINHFSTKCESIKNKKETQQGFLGDEIIYLLKTTTSLSKGMIYKSFYKAGLSFNKECLYSFEQSYRIVVNAYTTIARPKKGKDK